MHVCCHDWFTGFLHGCGNWARSPSNLEMVMAMAKQLHPPIMLAIIKWNILYQGAKKQSNKEINNAIGFLEWTCILRVCICIVSSLVRHGDLPGVWQIITLVESQHYFIKPGSANMPEVNANNYWISWVVSKAMGCCFLRAIKKKSKKTWSLLLYSKQNNLVTQMPFTWIRLFGIEHILKLDQRRSRPISMFSH